MMASGALQGLLVDIPSVERFGFTTLGELLDNPEAVAHFDRDGDGKADIYGCDDGWGCQKVINDTLAKNGWDDRATQVSATFSALFAESQASVAAGGPVLQYVWTPTAFMGKLVPGRDVLWLAIEPEQALEGQDGVSAVGDACTNDPCTTMFTPSDIVVTANKDFLAANPAAASLLENFELDPLAVAVQAVAIDAAPTPTPRSLPRQPRGSQPTATRSILGSRPRSLRPDHRSNRQVPKPHLASSPSWHRPSAISG